VFGIRAELKKEWLYTGAIIFWRNNGYGIRDQGGL
jgi:hypothetical protein